MHRLHLFEIEDLACCPTWLRDFVTEILSFFHAKLRHYDSILPLLQKLIEHSSSRTVLDLCSGASGPLPYLQHRLAAIGTPVQVILTDKFPYQASSNSRQAATSICFHPQPVDATSVPVELHGIRTLFTSFHHFRPEECRKILSDAANKNEAIGIFEVTERSCLGALQVMGLVALAVLMMPLIRPFSLRRLFWTYCIPLIPAVLLWDGLVSCLRTYTPDELLALVPDGAQLAWHAGRLPSSYGTSITYLLGYGRRDRQYALHAQALKPVQHV